MHIVFFPLGFAPTKARPQPCIHSAFYTILEKTLPHDAIYMLRLGWLVIMWLGGKTHIFPSAASGAGGNFSTTSCSCKHF